MADNFSDVSDKLAKALASLDGAKKLVQSAEANVVEAASKRDKAAEGVKAVEAAVAELHRTLKAHVEEALGVKHNG